MKTVGKVLKGIGYGLILLFILISALILLCAARPELSGQIAERLHLDALADRMAADEEIPDDTKEEDGTEILPDSVTVFDTNEDDDENDTEGNPQSSQSDISVTEDTGTTPWFDYDNPLLSRISVPGTVTGKSGYEPVQDNSNEIEEAEADRLSGYLSTGETGDGLTFDSLYYPYYHMLDSKGQHLYRQIYANADALSERFAPVEPVSVEELKDVFAAVYNDHPELFWVDTVYSCKYRAGGSCVEISLQYNATAKDLASEKETFNDAVDEIVSKAQQMGDNYHKEKYVHDALIEQIEYKAGAEMSQSAYSALVNGSTVCAGYARAMQYILRELGIPCYYCTGYAGENHAWNIVLLNNEFYNVDVTWDDTEDGNYDYFNKPDSIYDATHIRQDLSRNLPDCNGVIYGTLEDSGKTNWDDKRSLANLGVQAKDALDTIEAYYEDCYNQLIKKGKGAYSFQNVIAGKDLMDTMYNGYQSNEYRDTYMNDVMEELEASSCGIQIMVEELRDGYYLVIHQVSIE